MKRLTRTSPACSIYRGALLLLLTTAWPASLPAAEVDACPASFATAVDYATDSGSGAVAIGDLNTDGKPDLVATHSGGAGVSVMLNRTTACGAAPAVSPCCSSLQFDCDDYGATCVDTSAITCECAFFCGGSSEPCFVPNVCVDVASELDACGVSHGTTSTCLPVCGFGTCDADQFCCNGNSCCNGGTEICLSGQCVEICPVDMYSCGPPNCCFTVGEICIENVCFSDCGLITCLNHNIETCCGRFGCCDNNTEVCVSSGSDDVCEPIAVCEPSETYIESLNNCCPNPLYCPVPTGGQCCNPLTQQCALTPAGPACVPRDGSPSPGEVSRTVAMRVTDYNKLTGKVTVSYDPACGATGITVHYGWINGLKCAGTYSGRVCGLGNTGTATFDVPEGSFFVVVGRNDRYEGSYGTMVVAGTPSERPVDWTNPECLLPLNLAARCD